MRLGKTLERLRAALSQSDPDPSCPVTVSIGAVTFMIAPDDVQAMVQIADSVMYSAKKGGKNQVRLELVDRDIATAEAPSLAHTRVQRASEAG